MADWRWQRDGAGFADQEIRGGLVFLPAGGFGGFGFEFGDRFDGVADGEDFGVGGVEFLGEVFGAGEGAVGFFVEASGDGFKEGGQDLVVGGVGEGQTGLNG